LRSKSKLLKPYEIENFCLKFPHLSESIFGQLDYQSLLTCTKVSRFWREEINNQRTFLIRKIQKGREACNQFSKEWSLVAKKAPKRILKILVNLAPSLQAGPFKFRGDILSGNCTKNYLPYMCNDWNSPLHVATKCNLGLFKEIAKIVADKNPSNYKRQTPLHCAVTYGKFDICQFIIDNVQNKNPADELGFTPLHYAVFMDHLEIYKLIFKNAEDKNPKSKFWGSTPALCAKSLPSSKKVFEFISENMDTSLIKFSFKRDHLSYNFALNIRFSEEKARSARQDLISDHFNGSKNPKIMQNLVRAIL
jgi:hypothetical protein